MDVKSRRGRARKVLGILFLVVFIVVGSTWLWISSIAADRAAQMEQQVRQLHREALARDDTRPPLHGEALTGNSWSDYSAAISEGEKLRRWERLLEDCYYYGPSNSSIREYQALIEAHGIIADHLCRGARKEHVGYPFAWEQGKVMRIPTWDTIQPTVLFAVCRARELATKGRSQEAMLALLDLLQLARDLSSNSVDRCTEAASAVWNRSTLELKELLFSGQFARFDLSTLDDSLEQLDRHFPLAAPILWNNTLALGFELLKPEEERVDNLRVGLREYWRYAWSRKIADAEAFDEMLSAVRQVTPKQDGPVNESRIKPSWEIKPSHPLIFRAWDDLFRAASGFRYERTLLRLLRVAVHYRRTGEVLELEDPYGDKLRHEINGSDITVWSIGSDLVDNGGDDGGRDWLRIYPRPVQGRAYRVARDIVLTVER